MKALHGPEVYCMPEHGLCEQCLRAWLNRPPPKRSEPAPTELDDQVDDQLEAGHG